MRERGVDAYDFSHDKLREAAYEALSPARRRLLHRRVAGALEPIHASNPDTVARRLAVHYERAGLPQKAVPCYLRAGQAASRVYANDEAETTFRRGLALLEGGTRPPSREAWLREMAAGLYEGLGEVLRLGRAAEARMAYRNALGEIDEDDLLGRARLQRLLGFAWTEPGQFDRALQAYDAAEALLGTEPVQPFADWWREWLEVQNRRLYGYYCLGRWRDMAQLLDRMRPTVDRHGMPPHRAFFLSNCTLMAMRRDRYQIFDETLATAWAALAAAREWEDPFWLARQQYLLGWALVLRGDLEEAETHLQAALALSEQTGFMWVQAVVLSWLTVLYRRRGRVAEVRSYSSRALAVGEMVQQLEQVALAQANLAWVAWRAGDLGEAEALGQAALESWQRSQFVHSVHWTARWPLLAIALHRGRISEALDHAREMLDPQQQQLPQSLESALERAIQAGDEGQPEAVRAHLRRAIDLAQELGYL